MSDIHISILRRMQKTMISLRKIPTLFIVPSLAICAALSTHANAAEIADITDSIGVNIASQNWNAVDAGYEELYEEYQIEYGVGSGQALAMAKVLGEWKIQAYRDGRLSEDSKSTITYASNFYTKLISEVTGQQGAGSSQLIDPLYGQAMVEYHLFQLAAVMPITGYVGIGPETLMERQCISIEGPGSGEEGCNYIEVPNQDYIQSQRQAKNQETLLHWEIIGASLQKIADISEANFYFVDQAEALTHLGDYHLFREETESAMEFYQAAYLLLSNNPEDAQSLKALFEKPTAIPVLSLSFPGMSAAENFDPNLVLAFDLSAEGRASNVEVVGGSDSSNMNLRENVSGFVMNSIFRPQYNINGLIESKRVEMDF